MTLLKWTLRHPACRPASWLVMLAMLATMVVVAPERAEAQEQQARSVVVLDFADDPSGDALMGRAAQSALMLQMTERNYDVRSRKVVVDTLLTLGLREPYEPDEIRRLYSQLDAEIIITGRVVSINEGDGPPPWARVVLRVEVYDGASGDLVNGAISEGYEQGAGTTRADREVTRNEAVERAVAKALDGIESRTLVTAAVLQFNPRRERVLVNRGSRHGVYTGMEFDLFRTFMDPADPARTIQRKVGRIRIAEVSADDSDGIVLSAPQGIEDNDLLREAFTLPSDNQVTTTRVTPDGRQIQPASRAPKRSGMGGALTGLLGAVAGVGLLMLLLSMNNNTNMDAPRVNASQGAFLRQATPGQNPSVEVQWSDRDFSPPPNFIGGYLVYRSQSEAFAANPGEAIGVVSGAAQRRFSDTPTWELIETTITIRYIATDGDAEEEDLDIEIVHESPQPGQTYFYKVRRLGPPATTIPPTLIETGQGNRSANSRSRNEYLRRRADGRVLDTGGNIRVTRSRTGVGLPAHRQVTFIPPGPNYDPTLNPYEDNDLDIQADIGLSNASAAVGPVTYLVPPDLQAPTDNNQAQSVDDINFQYQGVLGATEYVLQISRSVNFSPLVFSSSPIQTTASSVLSFRYDRTKAGFVSLAPNTTYFWRVGAKSTFRNQRAPEPDGYVFSRVFTFATADQPPAAP